MLVCECHVMERLKNMGMHAGYTNNKPINYHIRDISVLSVKIRNTLLLILSFVAFYVAPTLLMLYDDVDFLSMKHKGDLYLV